MRAKWSVKKWACARRASVLSSPSVKQGAISPEGMRTDSRTPGMHSIREFFLTSGISRCCGKTH
jgi:hypothetical protein